MKEKFKIVGIIALAAIFALSFMSCDEPVEDCLHESVGDWEIKDGKIVKICSDCSEAADEFEKSSFYGDWVSGARTINISAEKFDMKQGAGNDYVFTISAWGDAVTNANTATGALSKDNYKFGYAITGTTAKTGFTETSPATTIHLYFKIDDKNKITYYLAAVQTGWAVGYGSMEFTRKVD